MKKKIVIERAMIKAVYDESLSSFKVLKKKFVRTLSQRLEMTMATMAPTRIWAVVNSPVTR